MMEKYDSLLSKHKTLKQNFVITSEASEKTISDFSLVNSNLALRSKISKLEEEITSSTSDSDNEKKYEKSFQHFLAKWIERSQMASMIYGVSRNKKKGLGYSEPYGKDKILNTKPKSLYE